MRKEKVECATTAALALCIALVATRASAADGFYDSGWAGGGRQLFGSDVHNPNRASDMREVLLEPTGNLLLGGGVDPSGFDYWWLGELRPDGTPSPTFGENNGLATGCHLSASLCTGDGLSAFTLQGDGRLDVVDNKTLTRTIARAQSLDTAGVVGGTGHVSLLVPIDTVGGNTTYGSAIAATPSGQWIVVGGGYYNAGASSDFSAIRLGANFSLDTTFNQTGTFSGGQLVAFDSGGSSSDGARAVIVQSNGDLVLAGYASPNDEAAFARLKANGALDTTFGGSGTGTIILAGLDGNLSSRSVKIDRAGRLLLATRPATGVKELVPNLYVVRLTVDGVPDSSLGSSGIFKVPVPSQCAGGAAGNVVALDSAGRILVAGACSISVSEQVFLVWRLRGDDGALDTNFGINGFAYGKFDGSSIYDEATDIIVDGSGHPIVVGVSQPMDGTRRAGVSRLTYDLIYTDDLEVVPRGYLPGQ